MSVKILEKLPILHTDRMELLLCVQSYANEAVMSLPVGKFHAEGGQYGEYSNILNIWT